MDNSTYNNGLCIPPPSIPISSADYESRFQHFMQLRQSKVRPRNAPVLSETKASLNHILELSESVQEMSTILTESQNTMSDTEWTNASTIVIEQQQLILDLLSNVVKPHRINRVRKAIRKRREKRIRNRSRPSPTPRPNTSETSLPNNSASPVSETSTQTITPTSIVSTHKLSQANAFLVLFDRLRELHRVRSQQAGRPCHTPSTLIDLTTLWTHAADHYELEEQKQGSRDETKNTKQMWQQVLFGPAKRNQLQFDEEPDLQRLIEIR